MGPPPVTRYSQEKPIEVDCLRWLRLIEILEVEFDSDLGLIDITFLD